MRHQAGQGDITMEEVLWTILSIVGTVAIIFIAPLVFMYIFGLVSGFNERMSEHD
jgi:uncharacterized membrane protein YqhA